MKWKYKVGDRGTYSTFGQGSVERVVTIVAMNPAGQPLPPEYAD